MTSNVQPEWLGIDVYSWAQSIRNGYVRAFILFALHNTGVFEALRGGQARTSAELAEECQVEADLLDGLLRNEN